MNSRHKYLLRLGFLNLLAANAKREANSYAGDHHGDFFEDSHAEVDGDIAETGVEGLVVAIEVSNNGVNKADEDEGRAYSDGE